MLTGIRENNQSVLIEKDKLLDVYVAIWNNRPVDVAIRGISYLHESRIILIRCRTVDGGDIAINTGDLFNDRDEALQALNERNQKEGAG